MTLGLESILNSAASGMSAQNIRMNTIASNLANAGTVGNSETTTYHAKVPVFQEITNSLKMNGGGEEAASGVKVSDILTSKKPIEKRYDPSNPNANADGFVFMTNVNAMEEMTNMISASREYQAQVEVMNTAKSLINQTITALNTR